MLLPKQWMEAIRRWLPALVFLLFVLQPLLDIAGYWQSKLGLGNTMTMALRMLLLGGTVLLGFLLSHRKSLYLWCALILGLLTLGHIYACTRNPNGYREAVTDLINLVRIYFLPLMTLCIITFLRENEAVYPALIKALVTDLGIIVLVQLISTLTGTDPHTYSVDSTGILGWFLWTNSQSVILAMLCPIVISWALLRWKGKLLPVILVTAISEAALYVLAPRLAYASLAASGLGICGCLLLMNRKNWRQALAVGLVTCLFLAAYPISPTAKRVAVNAGRTSATEKRIRDLGIEVEVKEDNEAGEETVVLSPEDTAKMEELYRSLDIIWSMVDRFGRDRVFKIYHYTLSPRILCNTRTMKINFCKLLMEESGLPSKLFGLNLKEMTHTRYDYYGKLVTDNYDVENDLHGVYFLTGYVGLGLMLLFLAWFGLRGLIAVIRRPKQYFHLATCAFALAYCMGLAHAFYTASVLRRNNASIYLAAVLACIWFLSRREAEKEPTVFGPEG